MNKKALMDFESTMDRNSRMRCAKIDIKYHSLESLRGRITLMNELSARSDSALQYVVKELKNFGCMECGAGDEAQMILEKILHILEGNNGDA